MCLQKFQYLDVVRRSIYFYSKMHVSAVQLTAVSLRLHGVTNFSQPSPPPYRPILFPTPSQTGDHSSSMSSSASSRHRPNWNEFIRSNVYQQCFYGLMLIEWRERKRIGLSIPHARLLPGASIPLTPWSKFPLPSPPFPPLRSRPPYCG